MIIAIAVYFCIADGVLIAQCLYYKSRKARLEAHNRRRHSSVDSPDPTTPLLGRPPGDNVPTAQEANGRRDSDAEDTLAKVVGEGGLGRSAWAKNTISLLGICVVGLVGWTVAWQTGMWKPAAQGENGGVDMAAGAQVLGYFSAVAYLGYVCLQSWFSEDIQLTKNSARGYRRSTRITATNHAKDCLFCSSSCLSWAI